MPNEKIYIRIKRSKDKEQPWFYVVKRKGNNKTLSTAETVHNFDDCVKSAQLYDCPIFYPKGKEPK
jgi:hypothetical protein